MSHRRGRHSARRARGIRALACVVLVAPLAACVTVAEHRKLERRVLQMERGGGPSSGDWRAALADANAEVEALRAEVKTLKGRVEVAEKTAADALDDARRARQETATREAGTPAEPAEAPPEPQASEEVRSYRAAHALWRSGDLAGCIDQFAQFLQSHPSSSYADDATFWMADCYFKQGDFKQAVLRFDDVVRKYPTGNKAPDALFRQGEALLELGPGYHEAAKRAFERVLSDYPNSALVGEAKKRLEVARAG